MLQIPTNNIFKKLKSYNDFAQLYLPETVLDNTIAATKQELVIQQLNKQIDKEQFYFITDVKTGEIVKANGVNKWLGYSDEQFTQKKYVSAIVQSHTVPQGLYASAIFEALINKQISFKFLMPLVINTVALKSKTGKYLYCTRRCAPFQITSNNKLSAYLSEFTIVKEHGNEAFHTRWNVIDENNRNKLI